MRLAGVPDKRVHRFHPCFQGVARDMERSSSTCVIPMDYASRIGIADRLCCVQLAIRLNIPCCDGIDYLRASRDT